jgi:predicted TIM-barrel fold metal-dependent hydrolase
MPKSKLSNLIGLRRVYCHVGPKIIEEHMELSGIGEVLLLPVAQSSEPIDSQMNKMSDIFGPNPKFHFSCSIPNTTPNSKISQFIENNIEKYKIKAIKLHPNITEINMGTASGRERVEGILASCRQYRLPLIIHGGRSPVLENKEASEYGHLKNFENINWHTSAEPIVIAHGGGYGCDSKEIAQDVLPRLAKLLNRYSNLMIDISGLKLDALVMILKQIDIKRILFGSDALYYRQWAGLVRVMLALKNLDYNIEESLVQLGSINPSKYIFNRAENSYAKITSG